MSDPQVIQIAHDADYNVTNILLLVSHVLKFISRTFHVCKITGKHNERVEFMRILHARTFL